MSAFSDTFAERFASAADRAGMRVDVLVRPKDCALRPYQFRGALVRPDMIALGGAISTDWELEYVSGDAPVLNEDDEVEIGTTIYRVREKPRVPVHTGVDGTFTRATLSRVGSCGAP